MESLLVLRGVCVHVVSAGYVSEWFSVVCLCWVLRVCVCSEGRLCMCWVLSSVFPHESEERVPRWFLKGVCLHVGF